MRRLTHFAAAGSAARHHGPGGTDLFGAKCAPARWRPALIVDIKKIAEMTAIEETAGGGFRGRAPPSRVRELAEHARLRQKSGPACLRPSNLIGFYPDPGGVPRRGGKSVQWLSRRRQCARDDRGPAPSSRCKGRAGAARCRSNKCRPVPAATSLKPGEILVSFTLPPAAAGVPAMPILRMISAHRNGHRRCRMRGQPHASRMASALAAPGRTRRGWRQTVLRVDAAAKKR